MIIAAYLKAAGVARARNPELKILVSDKKTRKYEYWRFVPGTYRNTNKFLNITKPLEMTD